VGGARFLDALNRENLLCYEMNGAPLSREHRIRSRAFDVDGNVQPAPDDPYLAGKVTYWESDGQITRRVRIP
jgi:hypothetical protein